MLKKKKTTASGKLVLVKSVRRHWASGGCPFSADRSGTETAQPQNEILCSKGLGGAALNKQAERKIAEGFSSLRARVYHPRHCLPVSSLNRNNFGTTTVLTIPHDGGGGSH